MLLECTSAECIVLLLTGNAFVAVHLKKQNSVYTVYTDYISETNVQA